MYFSGIFPFLLKIIVIDTDSSTNIVQISFDLLGELIKNNPLTINILTNSLKELNLIDSFVQKVMGNLEDSNVFLRHLILSKEMMYKSECRSKMTDKINIDLVSKFYGNIDTIIYELMGCVKKDSLTFDNLCCINTIIMFTLCDNFYMMYKDI